MYPSRMSLAGSLRSRKPEPVALEVHAADNLRFIRETMERAGSFTALPGWGGAAIGLTAVGAAWQASQHTTSRGWLTVWLIEAAVAIAIASVTTVLKAHAARMPLVSGPSRKFALSFAPPLLVGALLTVVLYQAGLERVLPGVWLLLYGTAVVTGGAFSVRVVPMMGLCFMLVGVAALFAPAGTGDWFMAVGFGGLQIIFGLVIALKYGG